MNAPRTEFGKRLFANLRKKPLPADTVWPQLPPEEQAWLSGLVHDIRNERFATLTPPSAIRTCLNSGLPQTCSLTWQTESGPASGEIRMERTEDDGLLIARSPLTDTWRRASIVFHRFVPLSFQPFHQRLLLDDAEETILPIQYEPAADSPTPTTLAADSADDDDLELAADSADDDDDVADAPTVQWHNDGTVAIALVPPDDVDEGWAVAEITWMEADGEPVVYCESVHLVLSDDEFCLEGRTKLKRPRATVDGIVKLTVRPLEEDDLWLLDHDHAAGPSQVTQFRAFHDDIQVRQLRRTPRGLESKPLPSDAQQSDAVLAVTLGSGNHDATDREHHGSATEKKDDAPADGESDVDRLLRKYHKTGDVAAFEDAWAMLQPQIEAIAWKSGDWWEVQDILQQTATRLWVKARVGKRKRRAYCMTIAENLVIDYFRGLRKTHATNPAKIPAFIAATPEADDILFCLIPDQHLAALREDEREYCRCKQRKGPNGQSKPMPDQEIADTMGLEMSTVRNLRRRLTRKLRILWGLDVLKERIPEKDAQAILWAEDLGYTFPTSQPGDGRPKRELRRQVDTVVAITSLLRPDRPTQHIVNNPLRERLSWDDVDLAWWWLFERLPDFELRTNCGCTAPELEAKQRRIGRLIHAQYLIEHRASSNQLRHAGRQLLELSVIDGHPRERAQQELGSRLKKWDQDFAGLLQRVEEIWSACETMVPREFAVWPLAGSA